MAFVREARAQRGAVATGARSRPLEIAVERPIAGSGAAARVEPGTPVAIITNTPLTRLALPDLVETLYGARAPDAVAAAFATGDYPPMEGSLRRSLGLTTATSTGLEGEVLGDDRSRVLAELQDGDVAVSEELWDSIMPATKLFFGAWAALETEPQVVFLDAEAVAAVEPNERKILLERAGPAIVFVTYPTVPDALPEWVADMYLMRHKGAIRYIGARERFGNDREMLERFVERPSKTPLAEPFDPEDDTL